MDRTIQKQIISKLESIVYSPYSSGKQLKGTLAGLWRYRVGNYRVVCDVENENITIYVIDVDHRSKIYR